MTNTLRAWLRYPEWTLLGALVVLGLATALFLGERQLLAHFAPPALGDSNLFAQAGLAGLLALLTAELVWRKYRLHALARMATNYHWRSCRARWRSAAFTGSWQGQMRQRLQHRADAYDAKSKELAAIVATY